VLQRAGEVNHVDAVRATQLCSFLCESLLKHKSLWDFHASLWPRAMPRSGRASYTKILTALFFFTGVLSFSLGFAENEASAFSLDFTDDHGSRISLDKRPQQVVSLVPGITEIMFGIGAGDALKGVTYQTTLPGEVSEKAVVGGFSEPSIAAIERLDPDTILLSDFHGRVRDYFKGKRNRKGELITLIEFNTSSVSHGIDNTLLLGKIFGRKKEAERIKTENEAQIELIREKLNSIRPDQKLRVMRLMGRESVMTPGNDSFQNEIITMSGGIAPDFGRSGDITEVSKEEWIRFNPQVLYGCGDDKVLEESLLNKPGWRDVDAVKNHRIYYFPCELTCRAATHTGYFVQWLSATIYGELFAAKEKLIHKDGIFDSRRVNFTTCHPASDEKRGGRGEDRGDGLTGRAEGEEATKESATVEPSPVNIDYVREIRVDESHVLDFVNRTLVVSLKEPMAVVSTLEGERHGITTVMNHYTPPQNWLIDHSHGLEMIRKRICNALGVEERSTTLLITGADMNNLAVKRSSYRELDVYAFVTAGVNSNAMRMSKDRGEYYRPGTINVIVMANRSMSHAAMTRAIITATEAKSAALLDMDIRSSYNNGAWRATGTGTDNVVVLQGSGKGEPIDSSGGHTKLGELIADAVYQGVQEAIFRQNGLSAGLNLFERLKKRGISIHDLVASEECDCKRSRNEFVGEVEALLLDPSYEGFMEAALALSDDYEKGLIEDLTMFEQWCRSIAGNIAGREIKDYKELLVKAGLSEDDQKASERAPMPHVIHMALNALFNGIYFRAM